MSVPSASSLKIPTLSDPAVLSDSSDSRPEPPPEQQPHPHRRHLLRPPHPAIQRLKGARTWKKRSAISPALENGTSQGMSSHGSRTSSEGPMRDDTTTPMPSPKKNRSSLKDADWSEVTNPEQRRRIQNRIAQRKFSEYSFLWIYRVLNLVLTLFVGEKAKESKEKAARDAMNRENAGNCYRIPNSEDFSTEDNLSGLPWGSVNLSLVVARGHQAEGRRSSGRNTLNGDDMIAQNLLRDKYDMDGMIRTSSYGNHGLEDTSRLYQGSTGNWPVAYSKFRQ